MIEHHVYFWLNEEHLSDAGRHTFEKGLESLFRIDGLAGGMWGKPADTPPRPVIEDSYHYGLSLHFHSIDQHNEYQEDPVHKEFVETFKPWWNKVRIFDISNNRSPHGFMSSRKSL